MPRLTSSDYLLLHGWLAELWAEQHGRAFGLISPRDQWYLHDYFVPSWTALTEAELLAYRQKVASEHPSLPQCAGRAVRKLRHELAVAPPRTVGNPPVRQRKPVIVSAVAQPQIDLDGMARALLKAAEELGKRDDGAAA